MYFRIGLIGFKSTIEFYDVEKSGEKCNTVRIMNKDDFYELQRLIERWLKIRISLKNGDEFFTRTITDVSVVGEIAGQKLVVISWKHEEE